MVAGYVSLLCSISDKPLEYWSKQQSQSGRIRKILDSDLLENVRLMMRNEGSTFHPINNFSRF